MNRTGIIVAAGMLLASTSFAYAQMGGGGDGGSDSGSALSSNGGIGPNGRTGGGRYPLQGPYSYDRGYYRGVGGQYQIGPTEAPYPAPPPRRYR